MLVTTLVNAVSTQNAAGTFTNATRTALQTTTTAFALEVTIVSPNGQVSAQTTYRVWWQLCSTNSASAAAFAPTAASPKCLDVSPKNQNNGTTVAITDPLGALGLYLYCWVEMPSITAANGTLTVNLIEMN